MFQSIPNVSAELNQHIYNVLRLDVNPQIDKLGFKNETLEEGLKSITYLTKLGLIDNDEQFVEPESLSGELAIAAQWLRDNI